MYLPLLFLTQPQFQSILYVWVTRTCLNLILSISLYFFCAITVHIIKCVFLWLFSYEEGSGSYSLGDTYCPSYAYDFRSCTYSSTDYYSHYDDVAISCVYGKFVLVTLTLPRSYIVLTPMCVLGNIYNITVRQLSPICDKLLQLNPTTCLNYVRQFINKVLKFCY